MKVQDSGIQADDTYLQHIQDSILAVSHDGPITKQRSWVHFNDESKEEESEEEYVGWVF